MVRVIFGNELYLINQEMKAFAKGTDAMSFHLFEGFSDEIWQLAKQFPIFSEKNYIVIRCENLEDKGFEEYLEHMQEHTDILVIPSSVDKRKKSFLKLKKLGLLEEYSKVSGTEFQKLILEMAKEDGCEIHKEEYDYFVRRSGYFDDEEVNLYSIQHYMHQVCMNGEITKEAIDAFVPESNTTKIFALSSVLLRKNEAAVFKMATLFLNNKENPIGMLSLLLRSFRLAYKASLYRDKSNAEIAKLIGAQTFQFQDALVYQPEVVTAAMDHIQNGIKSIKTGRGESRDVFLLTLSQVLSCLE